MFLPAAYVLSTLYPRIYNGVYSVKYTNDYNIIVNISFHFIR